MLRWLALWPLTFGLLLYPVSNRAIRIATVVMILLLWLGMLWFVWSAKWLRMIVIGIPVIVIAFVFLPGHKTDRLALRDEYLDSLRSFDGTRYVWGGENRLGIDCSGLVRAALINASLRDSVATLNPSSLRLAVDLWWHDSSAKALGEEYRHQTILVSAAGAINEIASDSLQPGDLAVTEDGVHVLAFLDDTHWIEADPDEKKVIIVSVPSSNAWFSTPVKIVRWRPLDGAVQSSSGNEP